MPLRQRSLRHLNPAANLRGNLHVFDLARIALQFRNVAAGALDPAQSFASVAGVDAGLSVHAVMIPANRRDVAKTDRIPV
jgi:hypothetical protein